ncbi:MAG: SH3 domain-containing protein [Bacillota bacterium]
MKTYLLQLLHKGLPAAGLCSPGGLGSSVRPTVLMPHVSASMIRPDYWCNKMSDPDKVVMTPPEIRDFNKEIIDSLSERLYDLSNHPVSLSGNRLIDLMEKPFPAGPIYVMGKQVGYEFYGMLKNRMNLSGIKDDNRVEYAFTVRRTNIRAFPTSEVAGGEPCDPEDDYFQETALQPAEPAVILHRSADDQWYYAQTYNYRGWVSANDVAVDTDRGAWLDYRQVNEFLMVTGSNVRLNNNPYSPELSELEFGMGSRIPLADPAEVPSLIDGQSPCGNYAIKLPVRDQGGRLNFKTALLPVCNDVTEGYLPYTRSNIIRQAFKMQGERYGWGGMLNGRDCSSLVMDLYRVFGFNLPRNAREQEVTAGRTFRFEENPVDRQALLRKLRPGAALYFPGHVMLYLGEDTGRFYVISALGSYVRFREGEPEPEVVRVRGVVINDLTITRKNGKQWIEQLTTGKEFEKG